MVPSSSASSSSSMLASVALRLRPLVAVALPLEVVGVLGFVALVADLGVVVVVVPLPDLRLRLMD